jgi:hypothetical protein
MNRLERPHAGLRPQDTFLLEATVKIQRLILAAAGLFAIAACSGQSGTNPVVPSGPQPNQQPNSKTRAVCVSDTRIGYATCDSVIRTDVFSRSVPAYVERRAAEGSDLKTLASSNYFAPLDPKHIQSAYNLPSTTKGAGQIVGIVDAFSDPTAAADLAKYRSEFGLPPCTVASKCLIILNQTGHGAPLPAANAGWAGEISLDLDMVSATCPLCRIALIEANSNSLADLGTAAHVFNASGTYQISNSYGGSEYAASDPNYSLTGRTVVASTGDSSWYAGEQDPAAFSNVVAVGGTSIYPFNNTRGWYENAWAGGGSGCSTLVTRPAWQTSMGAGCTKRLYSDISAVADPFTGVWVYQNYGASSGAGFYEYGGTSVASPIIASIYALAGTGHIRASAQSIWVAGAAHSASLTDVITGTNGQPPFTNNDGQGCNPILICFAGVGYDGPTGWGTPYGTGAF